MFEQYSISGTPRTVDISGDITQSVNLNAEGFFQTLFTLPEPRCLDLLRIATGIYAIDRISKRKKSHGYIRNLKLSFEVKDIDFWSSPEVNSLLNEILTFLTDDNWQLHFQERVHVNGNQGHQDFFDLKDNFAPKQIALYSGGLDSAAGLANRFISGKNDFLVMTIEHHVKMRKMIKQQLEELQKIINDENELTPNFLHSTLVVSLRGNKSKRADMQELSQRSRAFLFCSTAAIAANVYDISTIEMFENGVGAINLPLMAGMLDRGRATRGAHPTFLQLMSKFSTLVMGKDVNFTLPFSSNTKAEMLQNLTHKPSLTPWLQQSQSCVHSSRKKGKTHCGRCPACIERHQAFLAAGITENLDKYETNIFTEPLTDQDERDYLHLHQLEAVKWTNGVESSQRRMTDHLRLTNVPIAEDRKINELQVRHSKEVIHTYSRELLKINEITPNSVNDNQSNQHHATP